MNPPLPYLQSALLPYTVWRVEVLGGDNAGRASVISTQAKWPFPCLCTHLIRHIFRSRHYFHISIAAVTRIRVKESVIDSLAQ